jgi:hypothetical protein
MSIFQRGLTIHPEHAFGDFDDDLGAKKGSVCGHGGLEVPERGGDRSPQRLRAALVRAWASFK